MRQSSDRPKENLRKSLERPKENLRSKKRSQGNLRKSSEKAKENLRSKKRSQGNLRKSSEKPKENLRGKKRSQGNLRIKPMFSKTDWCNFLMNTYGRSAASVKCRVKQKVERRPQYIAIHSTALAANSVKSCIQMVASPEKTLTSLYFLFNER